jgi:hypothetical protein
MFGALEAINGPMEHFVPHYLNMFQCSQFNILISQFELKLGSHQEILVLDWLLTLAIWRELLLLVIRSSQLISIFASLSPGRTNHHRKRLFTSSPQLPACTLVQLAQVSKRAQRNPVPVTPIFHHFTQFKTVLRMLQGGIKPEKREAAPYQIFLAKCN